MTAPFGGRPKRLAPVNPLLQLDQLGNPYGPSIRALEAIASASDLQLANPEREEAVRNRIAEMESVPPSWIMLANGAVELLLCIFLVRRTDGPIVVFPPTDGSVQSLAERVGIETITVPRSHRFAVEVDPAANPDFPKSATVVVQSPNDPTGTLLAPANLVRLTRGSGLVIVDERHGAYSPRSLRPMVGEFTNVAILKSFETWAGLAGLPLAYAIAPARLTEILRQAMVRPPAAGAVIAAEATLDDLAYVEATVERIRNEKSHLYRTLRKLNMIRPFPSWANFLLARFERGEPANFDRELRARGITLFSPAAPELPDFVRISAAAPDATIALKNALIEIAAGL
jgi:histidinol-phosphate aminotransferase